MSKIRECKVSKYNERLRFEVSIGYKDKRKANIVIQTFNDNKPACSNADG